MRAVLAGGGMAEELPRDPGVGRSLGWTYQQTDTGRNTPPYRTERVIEHWKAG